MSAAHSNHTRRPPLLSEDLERRPGCERRARTAPRCSGLFRALFPQYRANLPPQQPPPPPHKPQSKKLSILTGSAINSNEYRLINCQLRNTGFLPRRLQCIIFQPTTFVPIILVPAPRALGSRAQNQEASSFACPKLSI